MFHLMFTAEGLAASLIEPTPATNIKPTLISSLESLPL